MTEQITLKSGLRVNFKRQGQGVPLICIPGWGYPLNIFDNNIEALSTSYQVIAYDPRSHGDSMITPQGNNYIQHGKDLHELIEALGIIKCVLMGWSLGVYTAYSYLREFGDSKVKALIAVDESPLIIKHHDGDWGEGSSQEIAGLLAVVQEQYLPFFKEYMKDGFEVAPSEALLDFFTAKASSLSTSSAVGLLRTASTLNFEQTARSISQKMPVLNIIRKSWEKEAMAWIEKNQPSAEIKVFGHHLMLYEFPDLFNKSVIDFLKRHCPEAK